MEHVDDTGMSTRSKGPDYLVIDNFAEFFQLSKADLLGARSEVESITNAGCTADRSSKEGARCDALMWLQGLAGQG